VSVAGWGVVWLRVHNVPNNALSVANELKHRGKRYKQTLLALLLVVFVIALQVLSWASGRSEAAMEGYRAGRWPRGEPLTQSLTCCLLSVLLVIMLPTYCLLIVS
jgi:ABC-type Fe3+ transport system permease subunit